MWDLWAESNRLDLRTFLSLQWGKSASCSVLDRHGRNEQQQDQPQIALAPLYEWRGQVSLGGLPMLLSSWEGEGSRVNPYFVESKDLTLGDCSNNMTKLLRRGPVLGTAIELLLLRM